MADISRIFRVWLDAVIEYAKHELPDIAPDKLIDEFSFNDPKTWLQYFEDGYSPEDAFNEVMSYADD